MSDPPPDPDLAAAVVELIDRYEHFAVVRDACDSAIGPAHGPLREAYSDVIAVDSSLLGKLGQLEIVLPNGERPSRRLLRDIEAAAVHAPASPRTFAWNRTLERELRDDVNSGLRVPARRFDQIQRMRARGPLGQRPTPASRRTLSIGPVGFGVHVCAICERDHWTIAGDDLLQVGTDRPVCWLCGDEHDAELTSEMLAKAVDAAERWIVTAVPHYIEHWLELLSGLGMAEAAANVEDDCRRYQQRVREAKAAGLGHPETWFTAPTT